MRPSARGRRAATLPAVAALAWSAAACTAQDDRDPRGEAARGSSSPPDSVLVDDSGRPLGLQGPPERIVSLVPSATGILTALGAGHRLVGRTDFDTAAAVRQVPSVGGGLEPDLETLLSLDPDLVIRFAGRSDPGTVERLDALGIEHWAVRPDRVADVRRIVGRLGALTGREGAADSLVAEMDRALYEVRARVAGRPRVRVAYLLGGSPPWAAGPDTFIDEILQVAGGENVFDDLGRLYAPVSEEALLARDVDVILAAPGTGLDPRVRDAARVVEVPPGLEIPGADLARAARALAALLHPDAG